MAPNESPYDFLYVCNTNGLSISYCFRDICKMTFLVIDLGLRSKVISPNESPCVISYRCAIQMKSLSLIVFEIFAKMTFWVIDLGSRSKVISPNESQNMIFCLQYKWRLQPSFFACYLRKFAYLTFQGHLRSKVMVGFPLKK